MFLRNVVEEPRFAEDLDNFRKLFTRMDDVHVDITWTLSRDPRAGDPLTVAPDFRVFTTIAFEDTPAFWVLYTFDTENVYLHSIEPVSS